MTGFHVVCHIPIEGVGVLPVGLPVGLHASAVADRTGLAPHVLTLLVEIPVFAKPDQLQAIAEQALRDIQLSVSTRAQAWNVEGHFDDRLSYAYTREAEITVPDHPHESAT